MPTVCCGSALPGGPRLNFPSHTQRVGLQQLTMCCTLPQTTLMRDHGNVSDSHPMKLITPRVSHRRATDWICGITTGTATINSFTTASKSLRLTMSKVRHNSSKSDKSTGGRPSVSVPRPSASILLLSPTNKVLLLHRVRTSSAFPSAHVFPGGNLSSFHEGAIPDVASPARHTDGEAYRLAAIRETFEESGILLARRQDDGAVLNVPSDVLEDGRRQVHSETVRFGDWVASLGGRPDVDNLHPFTRWITPNNQARRFTTQMYLYMLPITASSTDTNTPPHAGVPGTPKQESIVQTPTHDGGLEHTAATFDSVSAWLDKARDGSIILFPPQLYLLTLLSEFMTGDPPSSTSEQEQAKHYSAQRAAVMEFLARTPTTPVGTKSPRADPAAMVPWAEKVISPSGLFMLPGDGRLVLGLHKPGPELADSGRAGDPDRVVLVDFRKEGPRRVEVRSREEVMRLRREAEKAEDKKGKL